MIVVTVFLLISNQMDVRLDPNQPENGKYNLISGWYNKISKRFLCVCLHEYVIASMSPRLKKLQRLIVLSSERLASLAIRRAQIMVPLNSSNITALWYQWVPLIEPPLCWVTPVSQTVEVHFSQQGYTTHTMIYSCLNTTM